MQEREINEITQTLKSALGLLDKEQYSQLRSDAISICDYVANPVY